MSSNKSKSTKVSKNTKKNSVKKNKKKSVSLTVPDCWINELHATPINENNWKCCVVIMEEGSNDASVYIEHFNEASQKGTRLAVKTISKLDVIQTVVKNMVENNPDKEVTPLALLSSEIYKAVGPEFEKEIPTILLAPLIKYLLLEYKSLNKRIREGIKQKKKEFEENHQSLWQLSSTKSLSTKGSKSDKLNDKKDKTDSSKKGDKKDNKKGKPFTNLRKRGEEWKDIMWVDDCPVDGPQLYVSISTFFNPDLPLELLKLNIPLNAIINLDIWKTFSGDVDKLAKSPHNLQTILESLLTFRKKSMPHLSSHVGKRSADENYKSAQIKNFWDGISVLKTEMPTALMLKDVMFLTFTPEHLSFEHKISEFQHEIYRQTAHFLYDIFEITEKHQKYLSETKQTNVLDSEICNLSNMHLYNVALNSVPHEVLTLPFIIDAIVEQVCDLSFVSTIGREAKMEDVIAKTSNETFNSINTSFEVLIEYLNNKYDLFCVSENSNSITECLENTADCNIKNVLQHFDDTSRKTFHLKKEAADFIRHRTNHILQVAWSSFFSKSFYPSHNDVSLNFIKLCNEIITIARETNQQELLYYLYILIVNNILDSLVLLGFDTATKMNTLKENMVVYDNKELCEECLMEIASEKIFVNPELENKMSNIDLNSVFTSSSNLTDGLIASNLFYIEDLTSDVMVQFIQNIYSNFNCIETKFCPFTNQSIVIFHNLVFPKSAFYEERWTEKFTTHVPIRDFVEYVLDEERIWFEKHISQFNTLNHDSAKQEMLSVKDSPEMEFLFPNFCFISQRSIKYQKLLQQQNIESQRKRSPSEKRSSSSKKKSKMSIDTGKKSKGHHLKKGTDKENTDKEYHKEPLKSQEEKLTFAFTGFDLGDPMRFQFSGNKRDKNLDNGCRITLNTIEKLYGEKYNSLILTVNDDKLYYTYNLKNKADAPVPNSFHLILSSGIVLCFVTSFKETLIKSSMSSNQLNANKQSKDFVVSSISDNFNSNLFYQKNSSRLTLESPIILKHGDSYYHTMDRFRNSSFFPHEIFENNYSEIPIVNDLKISTPSGLHVEMVQNKASLYVRQKLLSISTASKSVEDEKLRCYLSEGYIIKFMSNGKIEILGANGSLWQVLKITETLTDVNNEKPSARTSSNASQKQNFSKMISAKGETLEDVSDQSNTKIESIPKKSIEKNKKHSFKKSITTDQQPFEAALGNFVDISHFTETTSDGKRSSSINSILNSRSLLPDVEQQADGSSILISLTAGAQLALEHCQQEFQWERWNCPDSVFSRKGRLMLTKETAFVSAITAAGIIYSIARNCSRGQLAGCGCHNSTRSGMIFGNASFPVHCLENLVYAEKVAAEFLQSLERDSRDTNAAINLHNFVVGKEAVRESLHQDCKCQGISSYCHNKVCSMKVGPFKKITNILRQSYEVAKKVDWNSVMTDSEILAVNHLLYMVESPDYCHSNSTTGWPGTVGRSCSRVRGPDVPKSMRHSCRSLCRSCGHVVRRRQRTVTYQCKCKFQWCCKVTCEQCTKVVTQHFCELPPSP